MNTTEIARAATAAGFRDQAVVIITAIAMAESGGDPNARNRIPPDDSWGLTQINMIGDLGPRRRSQFGITRNEQLLDPLTNLKAAYIVSGGGANFGPWSTFTSGRYQRFMTNAARGTADAGVEVGAGGAGMPGGAETAIGGLAGGTIAALFGLDDLAENALVVGLTLVFTVAALGLIALGLSRLTATSPLDAYKKAAKVIALPGVGKAAAAL